MTDGPLTARADHRTDPWCRLRLRGLRQVETIHSAAWSARIVHDGDAVGWVEDLGDGGPLTVRWTDPLAELAAREVADRLAGLIGRVLGDPIDDLMEKLAAVADLSRRRTVLWRIPNQDGTFWDAYRFRSFPVRVSWADALAYLAHPDRLHWDAELWDTGRGWWVPVADLM